MDREELLRRSRALRRELRDRQVAAGRRAPRTHREMRLFLDGPRERLGMPRQAGKEAADE